ncbi:sensor histidine kinase [Paenibacillus sp. MWE-103]|uniref:Sensor histidine kinase n=1 Tax=Paenibacillus artemisiicola TaxID=1172618 RepID=A0ABS3WC71_9BACL|nr:sensor histidine kinase [Paenibacillus artemisiicola]MBO7745736.1 sensor histidine kinase [Paenibacillus artemisiicola]
MSALRRYWETRTFKKKMILTFLPLVLFPMLFLTVLSSWIYSNQITKSMESNVSNTVQLVNSHLDTYLDELTRLSVLPYYNSQILNIMQETGTISDSDFKQIESLLTQAIRNPREDLQSVSIYRRDGQVFSSSIYNADINYAYDFKNSLWYKKAIAANGKVVFTGKINDSRIANRPEPAFSVVRAIKIYNGPILGVIIIDVNFTGLESIFKRVDLGKTSNIIVLDDQQQIIYSKNGRYVQLQPRLATLTDQVQDMKVGNETLIVNHIDSANTGWKIVGIVSEAEIRKGTAILYKSILTVSAILFLVIVIVSVLFSDTITKPLKALRLLMGKVEKGVFNVSYQALNGNMEISLVGRAFNKMNQKIDELINQVLESRFKQKEAELNTLKLQIRPHFLFNNLEAIRALAEIGDREGIVEITSALGGMLRYSLNKQDSKVALIDEIHQIQNYLRIEQIRSGDALVVKYDIDEALLTCITIPILLQPVVENCIHHGFDQAVGTKLIRIAVKPYEKGIRITVADNGMGMVSGELTKLLAYLTDETNELTFSASGIGLKNLHARIQLEYGISFGLTLESEGGAGMTVHIRIPRVEFRPHS